MTQIINGLLNIVMFQNGLIIGDIQGKNQFSTPRFSSDSLDHDKGYAFIEIEVEFLISICDGNLGNMNLQCQCDFMNNVRPDLNLTNFYFHVNMINWGSYRADMTSKS